MMNISMIFFKIYDRSSRENVYVLSVGGLLEFPVKEYCGEHIC